MTQGGDIPVRVFLEEAFKRTELLAQGNLKTQLRLT